MATSAVITKIIIIIKTKSPKIFAFVVNIGILREFGQHVIYKLRPGLSPIAIL